MRMNFFLVDKNAHMYVHIAGFFTMPLLLFFLLPWTINVAPPPPPFFFPGHVAFIFFPLGNVASHDQSPGLLGQNRPTKRHARNTMVDRATLTEVVSSPTQVPTGGLDKKTRVVQVDDRMLNNILGEYATEHQMASRTSYKEFSKIVRILEDLHGCGRMCVTGK